MSEAIVLMTQKGFGCLGITDMQGCLAGIVTDGDLRRWTLQRSAPLEAGVAEAMIRTPATIAPDALATEALRVMEKRLITSLPVVDEGNRLVGVIQIHDLWRTELF